MTSSSILHIVFVLTRHETVMVMVIAVFFEGLIFIVNVCTLPHYHQQSLAPANVQTNPYVLSQLSPSGNADLHHCLSCSVPPQVSRPQYRQIDSQNAIRHPPDNVPSDQPHSSDSSPSTPWARDIRSCSQLCLQAETGSLRDCLC